ncbi:PREDICTED: uncharacterized protein LOC109580893 [Amphimedon queenslandica]|uniref:Uncharacterized protein n=2 Tax=Amphimedon queenslandica TaxID=400682 RepID=A0AAN0IZX4_AMPQE|nr:PREDICTED: uncharacterized protein LOC109580893 [Amphimedon queenslandica]|eukprot:XP_019850011.1 PREDICTED: uncharacterized protein LOC109580893 [Amphimedon queenslandica]
MSFEVDQVVLENDQLLTPAARDEARLERILYQRRSVTPIKDDVNEDENSSAVNSRVCIFINKTLKMMWLLFFAVLLIFLFLVLVEFFEFCLGYCSNRQACSRSPLRMILGQYIQYTHTGEVPV